MYFFPLAKLYAPILLFFTQGMFGRRSIDA
jgi:hypothetical protein